MTRCLHCRAQATTRGCCHSCYAAIKNLVKLRIASFEEFESKGYLLQSELNKLQKKHGIRWQSIFDRYQAGQRLRHLAKEMNVSYQRVHQALARLSAKKNVVLRGKKKKTR